MPIPRQGNLRVATFNVENLFSRVKVFNLSDMAAGADLLQRAAAFQRLLEAGPYDGPALVKAFQADGLSEFIRVRVDRVRADEASPRFFLAGSNGKLRLNPAIDGPQDWSGQVEFERDRLSGASAESIRRVLIDELDADIVCLCEVEDRRVLQVFNDEILGGAYRYNMLVDGNDERGIDVAVLSRFPIGPVRTNLFARDPEEELPNGAKAPLFNRDCLEVEVFFPSGMPLNLLLNHFKSKGGPGRESETDPKRVRQAREVARILSRRYRTDLGEWREAVIVAGDLNERPDRNGANGRNLGGMDTSIDPLLKYPGLHNVLAELAPPAQRWTYDFEGPQQIDYLLVSSNLRRFAKAAGTVHSGRYTDGSNGIASPLAQASDHAAVWADFDLAGMIAR